MKNDLDDMKKICKQCGSNDVNHGDMIHFSNTMIAFEYECNDCYYSGKVFYCLDFADSD